MDSDDEVRDRATLYYQLLSSGDKSLTNQYILNNLQVVKNSRIVVVVDCRYSGICNLTIFIVHL